MGIINQMFANSLPLDPRVKFFLLGSSEVTSSGQHLIGNQNFWEKTKQNIEIDGTPQSVQ